MIPDEAIEAAHKAWRAQAALEGSIFEYNLRAAIEAAAPHLIQAAKAVDAILGLHREMPCVDEEGDPTGGSYCEACKGVDDGELVYESYPCMTVREINKALAGKDSYAAMRDKIEEMVK